MISDAIKPYVQLIARFVDHEINADVFEIEYMNMFQNEKEFFPQNIFYILDSLFADVDAYCADPSLRGKGDFDEQQLHSRCVDALTKLESVLIQEKL